MAKAVCCDRCGKFAKAESKEVGGWMALANVEWTPVAEEMANTQEVKIDLLLCTNCKVRFEEFMKPPMVKEG